MKEHGLPERITSTDPFFDECEIYLTYLCEKIWYDTTQRVDIVPVKTANHGEENRCMFLAITTGTGCRPPPGMIATLARCMSVFGLKEKVDWYPRTVGYR